MNIIEEKYWSHVMSLSGQERVARSVALLNDIQEMIALKITRTEPHLSARELKRRIAKQLYRSDPTTQRLLERANNGTV